MPRALTDEVIIRRALRHYQSERKRCDELNALASAFMQLLKFERDRTNAKAKQERPCQTPL